MKLPISAGLFGCALIVHILQVIPYTGIILKMLAGAYWPGLLISAGMICLACEALLGDWLFERKIAVAWLLVPAIYFIGYIGAYHASQQQFAQLQEEVRRANNIAKIAFDPAADTIYLTMKNGNPSWIAQALVSEYGVGRVYVKNANTKHASHSLYGIAPFEVCRQIDQTQAARDVGAGTFGISDGSGVRHFSVGRHGTKPVTYCGYVMPKDPGAGERLLKVELDESRTETWLLGTLRQGTALLTHAAGSPHLLKSGSASTLTVLPYPILGCVLDSGAPAWRCIRGFSHSRITPFGDSALFEPTIVPVVAKALGLSRVTLRTVEPYAGRIKVDFDLSFVKSQVGKSLDHVRELIAKPGAYNESNLLSFPGLESNPEALIPLVPSIVQELRRRVLTRDSAIRGNDWALQKLLSLLPAIVLNESLQPFLDALMTEDQSQFKRLTLELMERLDVMGPHALPVLERALRERDEFDQAYAARAVCRLGGSARPLAPIIENKISGAKRIRPEMQFAYFRAALSMGEEALAEKVLLVERNARLDGLDVAARQAAASGDRERLCRPLATWR